MWLAAMFGGNNAGDTAKFSIATAVAVAVAVTVAMVPSSLWL